MYSGNELKKKSSDFSYSVDVNLDKALVNKDAFRDPALRRKARRETKMKFEERYMSLSQLLSVHISLCISAIQFVKTKLHSMFTMMVTNPARFEHCYTMC